MLSYRHGFHAGNHADVLKHAVLTAIIEYLQRKPAPVYLIDTHAGAALHRLDSEQARKTGEATRGIGRLWNADSPPALLQRFLGVLHHFNPSGELQVYPGSSAIMQSLMRDVDRLRAFDLHPTEHQNLTAQFRGQRAVRIEHGDGFKGLLGQVPPASRRGLVLMDPSYENKQDFSAGASSVEAAIRRFATGTYVVWYPRLARQSADAMLRRLHRLAPDNWLQVELNVKRQPSDGFGMFGSGLYVINPPWTLPSQLADALPWLVKILGEDDHAGYHLDHKIQ